MRQPTYDQFVKEWPPALAEIYLKTTGRKPAMSDLFHAMWGIIYEGRPAPGDDAAPTPVPVVLGYPRRGASYYTCSTDPRCDIKEFATRLQDAGCNFTRWWLLDAWANGTGEAGCYSGWMPWVKDGNRVFDLESVNHYYLDRQRLCVEAMNDHGIVPLLSGLDLYTWSNLKAGLKWVPNPDAGPFRLNHQTIYYSDDLAFDQIGLMSGGHEFLAQFYTYLVAALDGLAYDVEIANEMPQKEMHIRLRDAWRAAGFTGRIAVNRQEDTPGQYDNMKIGQEYDLISYHGKRDLGYLREDYEREPKYRTFEEFFATGHYDTHRIILSSDGCRKSEDVNDAYDYRAVGEVFHDAVDRGFTVEHQSRIKLRGFTEGRIDLADLETDWLRSLWG